MFSHLVKKFPALLLKPKIHYRVQQSPSLVPVLNQINPVHDLPFCVFKIQFNIILPPVYVSFEWIFPFGFPTKPMCIRVLPNTSPLGEVIPFLHVWPIS